jgi:hypothetical protein
MLPAADATDVANSPKIKVANLTTRLSVQVDRYRRSHLATIVQCLAQDEKAFHNGALSATFPAQLTPACTRPNAG